MALYFQGLLFFLKHRVNLSQRRHKLDCSQRFPRLLQNATLGDDGLDHLDHVTCRVAVRDFGEGAEIQRLCEFASVFFNQRPPQDCNQSRLSCYTTMSTCWRWLTRGCSGRSYCIVSRSLASGWGWSCWTFFRMTWCQRAEGSLTSPWSGRDPPLWSAWEILACLSSDAGDPSYYTHRTHKHAFNCCTNTTSSASILLRNTSFSSLGTFL